MAPQEIPKGNQAPINKPILKDAPNQGQIDLLKEKFQNDINSLNTVLKYEAMKKGGRIGLDNPDRIIGDIVKKIRSGESYSNDLIYLDSALRQVGRVQVPAQPKPEVEVPAASTPKAETQAPTQPKVMAENDASEPTESGEKLGFWQMYMARRRAKKEAQELRDSIGEPKAPTQPKPEIQAPVEPTQPKSETQAPVAVKPEAENIEPLDRDTVVKRLKGYLTNDLNSNGFPEPTKSRVNLLRKHIEALVGSKDIEGELNHPQYGASLLGEPSIIRNIAEIDNIMRRVNSQDPNPIDKNIINKENNGLLDSYSKARGQIINRAVLEQAELRDSLVFTMPGLAEKITWYFTEDISKNPVMNRMRGDIEELNKIEDIEELRREVVKYKSLGISRKIPEKIIGAIKDFFTEEESERLSSTENNFYETTAKLFEDNVFRTRLSEEHPEITTLQEFRQKVKEDFNIANESFHSSMVKKFNELKAQLKQNNNYILLPNGKKIWFETQEDRDKVIVGSMLFLKGIVEDPSQQLATHAIKVGIFDYWWDYYTMGKGIIDNFIGDKLANTVFIGLLAANTVAGFKYNSKTYLDISRDGIEKKKVKQDEIDTYETERQKFIAGKRDSAPEIESIEGGIENREKLFEELKRDASAKEIKKINKWRKSYIYIKSDKVFSTLVLRKLLNHDMLDSYNEKAEKGKIRKGLSWTARTIKRTTWLNVFNNFQNITQTFKNPQGKGLVDASDILSQVRSKSFISKIGDLDILSTDGKVGFRESLTEMYQDTTDNKVDVFKKEVGKLIGDLEEMNTNLKGLERFKETIQKRLDEIGSEKSIKKMREGISELDREIIDIRKIYAVSDVSIKGELKSLIDEKIRGGLLNNDRENGKQTIKYIESNKASFISMDRLDIDLELISQIIDDEVPREYMDSIKRLARESKYDSIRDRMFLPPEEGSTRGRIDEAFLEDFKNSYGKVDSLQDFMNRYAPEANSTPEPAVIPERAPAPLDPTETRRPSPWGAGNETSPWGTEDETRPIPEPLPEPERIPAPIENTVEKIITKAEGIKVLDSVEIHYIELGNTEAAEAIREYKVGLQDSEFTAGSMQDLELDIKEILFELDNTEDLDIKSIIERSKEVKLTPWEKAKRLGKKIVTKGARR